MNTIDNNSTIENNDVAGEGQDQEGAALTAEAEAEDKAPAWIDFTAALMAHAATLGLDSLEQKGFVKFSNKATGHKLYVAKGGRAVKRVDTTLPILGKMDGTYELSKPNGKIECHVVAELDKVTAVLTALASEENGKLRPAKRVKAEETVSETPAAEAPAAE